MYIDIVPNRNSPPAILLRDSSRRGKKIIKRTLSNLSEWPAPRVDLLRRVLKGEALLPASQALAIERSLPHGHVAAVLGTVRRLGLEAIVARTPSPERDVVMALIVARVLSPASKLATARGLDEQTAISSLGSVLELEGIDEDRLYQAMDWIFERQEKIEKGLARRHLEEGSLVLYDVSSTYFEGRRCPLARFGHSRDEKPGNLQIVFGLLTNRKGCPVAVEVFAGNTGDPKTVAGQVNKLRQRFGLKHLVLVGDRGMLTTARIRENLRGEEGLEWITALRASQIQKLVLDGALQLSFFDELDLAEITHPAYSGERLMACRNPLLTEERSRKRKELLQATEKELTKIAASTERKRRPLRGRHEIGLRVGKILGHYKGLAEVERAFRSLKSVDLKLRPIYHHQPDRVRAHVFLCMLAYYVEWHMRQALAPMLFDDDDREGAQPLRLSVVAPAQRSLKAQSKAQDKHTEDGLPVHSFQTLLQDLATLTKNRVRLAEQSFDMIATPTAVQQRAFELLRVQPLL